MSPALGEVLARARDEVHSWGGELVFVYLPGHRRYYYAATNDAYLHRGAVLETVKSLAIPLVDMHRTFDALVNPLSVFPFGLKGHYNQRGYRIMARSVCEALRPTNFATLPDVDCDAIGISEL